MFVDAYPTTATGKIRRVELRAMAATVLDLAAVETSDSAGALMLDGRPLDRRPPAPGAAARAEAGVGRVGAGLRLARAARRSTTATAPSTRPRSTRTSPTQGVDVAVVLAEYSPKVTGTQPVEDLLPLAAHNPDRVKFAANVNPHLHYPVDEELRAPARRSARSR